MNCALTGALRALYNTLQQCGSFGTLKVAACVQEV